jgi:hypothetical protein
MAFRFSGEQIDALSRLQFENRLIELISSEEHDARTELESPAGREELRRQCGKAQRYGLTRGADIARYVITAWLMGPDFDETYGAMREVLQSRELSGAQKAQEISQISLAVLRTLAKA